MTPTQSTRRRTVQPAARRRRQMGTTSIEIVVAFTLLSSVLAIATPLVVKHGRLLASQRAYRLALDEVSNQLERLSSLPEEEFPEAIQQLAPSPLIAKRLPGAELRGEVESADIGRRLTLRLSWDEPQRSAAPVAMAAWILPRRAASSGQRSRSEP